MQQLLLDVFTPPRPNLNNFLVGENAQVLHALSCLLNQPENVPFVYLWGPTGCGKTHLIRAVGAQLGTKVRCGADRFVFKPESRFLLIDNIEKLTAFSQIQLFNAFNSTANSQPPSQIVLTGEKHLGEMPLRKDLQTRIAAGLCLRISPLSDSGKAAALQRMAHNRGLELSTEVTNYALQNFQRDMGSLTAVLDGLDRFSLEQKKPVSVHLLRHWMRRRESLVVREHETHTL